ncbi:CoA transferase [Rhodococcus sp. 14C212]|nr:CaiB/BaiF CoA-transferase family protein [Rhodococcus sp. 14C212]NGP05762.1 CoA transferase [Rhodococcus sp. 14C212]
MSGIRVVDLSRLSPGPYGSMLLADLGADVVVVGGGRSGLPVPAFGRGKEFVTLDLKSEDGYTALLDLVRDADVFLEGFRPGVADRLGIGFDALSELNPKLVYCSVTGYGQTGALAARAGHDINYLAVSGALGAFGPPDRPPIPPLNVLADFAGGGMLAAFGIVTALYERERSGRGQYIDAAMIDGVMSLMAMPFSDWQHPTFPSRGDGVLAGTMPAYRCYECADGRYVAVGALEDAFFERLWTTLELGEIPNQFDRECWPKIEAALTDAFATRARDEWSAVFSGVDACVTPVLAPDELATHPLVAGRHPDFRLDAVPAVPVLSRTPATRSDISMQDTTEASLVRRGVDADLAARVAAVEHEGPAGLSWPPM